MRCPPRSIRSGGSASTAKIKYVAKRLKPLRGLKGDIYGGKPLVVQCEFV